MTLWEIERWLAQDRGYHLGLRRYKGQFDVSIYKGGSQMGAGTSKTLEAAIGNAMEDLRLAEAKRQPGPELPPGYSKVVKQVQAAAAAALQSTLQPPPPVKINGVVGCSYCPASALGSCFCGCGKFVCSNCNNTHKNVYSQPTGALPPPQNSSTTTCVGCGGTSGQAPSSSCPCGCANQFCSTCVSWVTRAQINGGVVTCSLNCGEHSYARNPAGPRCVRCKNGVYVVRP